MSFDLISVFNLQAGLLLCPQTLSQTRRARLRRAFTEATGDTVNYVKTVGFNLLDYAPSNTAVDCTISPAENFIVIAENISNLLIKEVTTHLADTKSFNRRKHNAAFRFIN